MSTQLQHCFPSYPLKLGLEGCGQRARLVMLLVCAVSPRRSRREDSFSEVTGPGAAWGTPETAVVTPPCLASHGHQGWAQLWVFISFIEKMALEATAACQHWRLLVSCWDFPKEMINYPCVSIEVGSYIKPCTERFLESLNPSEKNSSVSFVTVCLWSKHQLFPALSFYFQSVVIFHNSASFHFFPVLWETLGMISLPDPVFLVIVGRSISRTPLAPSRTTRTMLCRAQESPGLLLGVKEC